MNDCYNIDSNDIEKLLNEIEYNSNLHKKQYNHDINHSTSLTNSFISVESSSLSNSSSFSNNLQNNTNKIEKIFVKNYDQNTKK